MLVPRCKHFYMVQGRPKLTDIPADAFSDPEAYFEVGSDVWSGKTVTINWSSEETPEEEAKRNSVTEYARAKLFERTENELKLLAELKKKYES